MYYSLLHVFTKKRCTLWQLPIISHRIFLRRPIWKSWRTPQSTPLCCVAKAVLQDFIFFFQQEIPLWSHRKCFDLDLSDLLSIPGSVSGWPYESHFYLLLFLNGLKDVSQQNGPNIDRVFFFFFHYLTSKKSPHEEATHLYTYKCQSSKWLFSLPLVLFFYSL